MALKYRPIEEVQADLNRLLDSIRASNVAFDLEHGVPAYGLAYTSALQPIHKVMNRAVTLLRELEAEVAQVVASLDAGAYQHVVGTARNAHWDCTKLEEYGLPQPPWSEWPRTLLVEDAHQLPRKKGQIHNKWLGLADYGVAGLVLVSGYGRDGVPPTDWHME